MPLHLAISADLAKWLEGLLSDSRAVVAQLLEEPEMPSAVLRQEILSYADEIAVAARADRELGALLVDGAQRLLDAVEGSDDAERRRLAQVAVRYFVLDDDGDDDLLSPFGLDDDVEVFNAVALRLELPELLIGYD